MMKQIVCLLLLVTTSCASIWAQEVALRSEGRDTAYVANIVGRSAKIVKKLNIADPKVEEQVCNIVANRYFELNDIYETRDAKMKYAKDSLTGNLKKLTIEAAKNEADSRLYRSHFAFPAALSLYLNEEQIVAVKDGMTFGVVKVTYDATLDMIPSLTEEEKAQILAWLIEARELAVDAESSKKKHEVFGKYKGRINNYLSKRGYDLVKEREGWYKRTEERKKAQQ